MLFLWGGNRALCRIAAVESLHSSEISNIDIQDDEIILSFDVVSLFKDKILEREELSHSGFTENAISSLISPVPLLSTQTMFFFLTSTTTQTTSSAH